MTVAQRNANLLCEVYHIHGEPYHTVRPTAVIRIEQWDHMLSWAQQQFGTACNFEPGCVGQRVQVSSVGERYYVDNTRFWFRHSRDRDCFVAHWTEELYCD